MKTQPARRGRKPAKPASRLGRYLVAQQVPMSRFAETIGVTPGAVAHWFYDRKKVSPKNAVLIEKATAGAISRRDLRPDLFT